MTTRSVVLDANIYVSALVFGGKPKRALQLAIRGQIHVAVSEPILTEVRRTLKDKFGWEEQRVAEAGDLIATFANRVAPTIALNVIASDPDDDRVLECAVTARAEVIVSGDSDLLDLGEYEGIRIMKVADFLQQVPGASTDE